MLFYISEKIYMLFLKKYTNLNGKFSIFFKPMSMSNVQKIIMNSINFNMKMRLASDICTHETHAGV
jgi:hypothetical protein